MPMQEAIAADAGAGGTEHGTEAGARDCGCGLFQRSCGDRPQGGGHRAVGAARASETGRGERNQSGDSRRRALFIAILTPESPSPNVLFEIGCAYGLQKQLLIMAPRGVSLPTDIQELQYIRADAQNREALSFALDQALAPKKSSSQRKTSVEKTVGDHLKT